MFSYDDYLFQNAPVLGGTTYTGLQDTTGSNFDTRPFILLCCILAYVEANHQYTQQYVRYAFNQATALVLIVMSLENSVLALKQAFTHLKQPTDKVTLN